jgi:3-hydroxyacyl-CoA dehydrogenase/enoyl-CoA hydratase/3-hydroxybutyryl-CoA epimerase
MIFGTGFAPFRGGPLHYKKNIAKLATGSAQRDAAE